ncbi:PREDICTED: stromelysin-2-like [Elephantulus edwardii]|uniref:stromelysin-2-like n=1 Tax=Elephantulus edwardii TaxID=28737 RepID=UPI0003F0607B|nr:PREDICTED: stromelysin-2-like [Elephantulus edwardii]
MKNFIIIVLLCLPVSLAYPLDKTVIEEPNIDFVQKYLKNYYNHGKYMKQFVRGNDSSAVVKNIQEMQRSLRLKVMQKRESDIQNVTLTPICGVPPIGYFFSTFPDQRKWSKSTLTYRIMNYTPKLSSYAVDSAVERALKLWEAVTPLTFTRLYDGEADIMISFMHRDQEAFAVPPHALAFAFSPRSTLNEHIHFYDDIWWTEDYSGINFFYVAAHEIGHSLGLFHSNDPEALMYTFYKEPKDQSQSLLSQDDVKNIQSLYGPPPSSFDYTKAPISRKSELLSRCDSDLSFDAVTTMRGEIFFFKGRYFWRKMHMDHKPVLYSISSHWPSLPSKLDAAYEAHTKDTVFAFKGNQFWAIKLLDVQAGYPRSIYTLGLPPNMKKIDAAFSDDYNRKTYFFRRKKYWRFDEDSQSMDPGFPRLITNDFPGVEQKIDAVFKMSGYFYFFSGPLQIEFNPNNKMVTKHLRSNSWLGCEA